MNCYHVYKEEDLLSITFLASYVEESVTLVRGFRRLY